MALRSHPLVSSGREGESGRSCKGGEFGSSGFFFLDLFLRVDFAPLGSWDPQGPSSLRLRNCVCQLARITMAPTGYSNVLKLQKRKALCETGPLKQKGRNVLNPVIVKLYAQSEQRMLGMMGRRE